MIRGSDRLNNKLVFKIAKRTIILVLLIVGMFAFMFKEPKPIAMGLIFGALISVLNFKLLDNTITKALKMPPNRATSFTIAHYFARYIIYFTVLLVAAKADYLNLISTIAGLFTVKFVILGSNIFDKNFTQN
jgi:nicotinamide riboside transporter PnuC